MPQVMVTSHFEHVEQQINAQLHLFSICLKWVFVFSMTCCPH
jgi:hypothetical protein